MKTALSIVIGIILFGVIFASAFGKHHTGDFHQHMYKHVADELDLTQAQSTQLKRNSENIMKQTKALHDMQSLMAAFNEQLVQPSIDQVQLNTAIDTYLAKWESALPQIIAEFSEFHATLNDGQRAQLVAWLEKHEKGDEHRHSKHGHYDAK